MKKQLKFVFIFLFFSIIIYIFWFFVPINFPFLEKLEVKAVNVFFSDKMITHQSFYGNYTYALEYKKNNTYYQFIVDRDCLGLNIFTAILVFVLSFPPSLEFLSFRVLFLFFSFFVVELINIIRLIFLYYLFKYHFKIYSIFHDFVWQITNIFFIFVLIIIYLKLLKFIKNKKRETN